MEHTTVLAFGPHPAAAAISMQSSAVIARRFMTVTA
jgi:hypothetical protein